LFQEIIYPCPFLIAPSFGSYHGFLDSGMLHIGKLLKQGFTVSKLKSSLYLSHKWPQQCSVCLSEAFKFARLVPSCDVRYDFHLRSIFDYVHVVLVSFACMYVYWCPTWCHVLQNLLTQSGSGPRIFSGVHVAISLVFCILFYGSLFVLLWFFTLPLCCLSFDVRLLITPVVSSSCSQLSMLWSPSKKINNVSTWTYYAIILSMDCVILQCNYFYDTWAFWRIFSAHDDFLE
jgi:hypothetical protein